MFISILLSAKLVSDVLDVVAVCFSQVIMTDFFSKMMTSNCESSKRNLIVNQLCNRSNDIHFNNDDLIDQEETPESDKATSNEESDSDSGSGSEDESIG